LITNNQVPSAIVSLNVLYDEMPKTSGCENCASEYGEDNIQWCCKSQSPSMYYIEFLNVWKEVQEHWSKGKKLNLIMRCIKNYLSNDKNKGCVFYDNGCSIYQQRPYVCRLYGVIPEETWNKRTQLLNSDIKQCHMVKSEKPISVDDDDEWFKHTAKCEERIGISKQTIAKHDAPGGTYRHFHDHILVEKFTPEILEMLSHFRLSNPAKDDIDKTVGLIRLQPPLPQGEGIAQAAEGGEHKDC
jgi:Fe-S-cluster containining protein